MLNILLSLLQCCKRRTSIPGSSRWEIIYIYIIYNPFSTLKILILFHILEYSCPGEQIKTVFQKAKKHFFFLGEKQKEKTCSTFQCTAMCIKSIKSKPYSIPVENLIYQKKQIKILTIKYPLNNKTWSLYIYIKWIKTMTYKIDPTYRVISGFISQL